MPLIVAGGLIGVGIWLIFKDNSTAQVIAGLGTIAGGLGVTWRSVATSLGHLSLDLARPLWGAEIDAVLGNRLTPPPQRDYVPGVVRPTGRWQRAWRELRIANSEEPRGAPDQASDVPPPPSTATPEQGDTTTAATEILPGSPDRAEDQRTN